MGLPAPGDCARTWGQCLDLTPLWNAPLAVKIHVATVVPAALIGAVQLVLPKGTPSHRVRGYIFMALMLTAATAAIFVRSLNSGGFSLIHLFIPLTYFGVASGLWSIRRGNVRRHASAMIGLYVGAILIAGLLTLAPGRIMHSIFFGH